MCGGLDNIKTVLNFGRYRSISANAASVQSIFNYFYNTSTLISTVL